MSNFNPMRYAWNGPEMLTRVLSRVCQTNNVHDMTHKACKGFNVLPQANCFNISYSEWNLLFDADRTMDVLKRLKDSIIVHYWNSLSKKFKFPANMTNAFTEMARELCPRVMKNVHGEFIT